MFKEQRGVYRKVNSTTGHMQNSTTGRIQVNGMITERRGVTGKWNAKSTTGRIQVNVC